MANNRDIAHAWAHNLDKFHYGSNFHHSCGYIYSYSTCIGQRFELNGKVIFVTNSYRYSSSTSKHQCYMSGAIPRSDDNVFCFSINRNNGAFNGLPWRNDIGEDTHRGLLLFGLRWIYEDYLACKGVAESRKLGHGFDRSGYKHFIEWLDVTKCATIGKLLRGTNETLADFIKWETKNLDVKTFKAFLKLLSESASDEKIVDAVNGKGTWAAYQKRIEGLLLGKKMRRLSNFLGFRTPNSDRMETIHGKLLPVNDGSITSKQCEKFQKKGVLLEELHRIRQENVASMFEAAEKRAELERREMARKRLELHCGLRGWGAYSWSRPYFTSFNYGDMVICFRKENYWFNERNITTEEYNTFRQLSREEQKVWIENKKHWMLEQLRRDQEEHERICARLEEESRIRRERAERQAYLEAQKAERKQSLLLQGESGLRQAWHEGFNVSVWNQNLSFYFGGNVLLRVVDDKMVETSKGIMVSKDECRRLWLIINRWHTENVEFEGVEKVNAVGNTWRISRYKNDILTAGCHSIAYCEMERVAKQLGFVA